MLDVQNQIANEKADLLEAGLAEAQARLAQQLEYRPVARPIGWQAHFEEGERAAQAA